MKKVGIYLPPGGMGMGIMRGIAEFMHTGISWRIMLRGVLDNHINLPKEGIDGIIAVILSEMIAQKIVATNIPAVNVSSRARISGMPSVLCNHEMVCEMAVEHFCQAGLRHFAAGTMQSHEGIMERSAIFHRLITNHGFSCVFLPDNFAQVWDDAPQEEKHEALLRSLPKPVGILATNDYHANAIIGMARSMNLRVPQDVAVLGVDNSLEVTQLCIPSISSIDINAQKIGFTAARALHELMQGNTPAGDAIRVDPLRLVKRGSTDLLTVTDADVISQVEILDPKSPEPR